MSTHKEALERVLKLCNESTRYSRRTQAIHDTCMRALGMTANQRTTRHEKLLQRVEAYQEARKTVGVSAAKKAHKESTREDVC